MSDEGSRKSRRQPAAPVGSPLRGAILIAVAVALGFLLIGKGLDDDGGGAVSASGDSTTTTVPRSTSTTIKERPVNKVKVVVANGSGVDGAASRFSNDLNTAGYVVGDPDNAENVDQTIVYYTDGYDREAQSVAKALGVPVTAAQPMSVPAPVDDAQGANIVVVIGPDLAESG